ncbi:C39 family peptidase [Bacillus timonensis]|uniref:C39 family peptidase n=1 Tax=Bacillus timonensis TaxID=1033734 RepID=UPI000289DACE|nr:C39 family peptidase [Bacillus timonensis]
MNKTKVGISIISLVIVLGILVYLTEAIGSRNERVGNETDKAIEEKARKKEESKDDSDPEQVKENPETQIKTMEVAATVEEQKKEEPADELADKQSAPEKPVFIPVKQRDKGEKVKEIQKLLNKFGYSVSEDGNFGPQTTEVVKDFQKQTKLTTTGVVNEETYQKLVSLESTNLAESYLAALAEKKRIEEQKKKEEEERRKKQAAIEKGNEMFIPVKKIMQKPALPNGCEITSLTSILNYHGHNVSHTVMADNYLPKKPFTYENGKRFGANPYEYYVGDPRQQTGGWYSYAPPIVAAGNKYLSEQGSAKKAVDITGSSKEQILNYIKNGTPVVMWVTLDLSKPKVNSHWYLQGSGEYYAATTNLHVVVLNGVIGNKVHVMNPLAGQVTYNLDAFFNSYHQMGKHAVIVQ